jgi:signal transduction histidine kinase
MAAKLRTLVFLCWAMLLVVAFTAVGSLAYQSENVRELTLINEPALDANNAVRLAMTEARTGLVAFQTSGDRTFLHAYVGARNRTTTALAALRGRLTLGAAYGEVTARQKALGESQRLTAEKWWAFATTTEQVLSRGGRADVQGGQSLYQRFSVANASLAGQLEAKRDANLLEAGNILRGVVLSVAATVIALLSMLILGRRVAAGISRPLTELRDTMVRQREGDLGARAREDQGSLELRSVAADFNALTEQNLALRQNQAIALGTHQITLQIARAIRAASNTQQALDVVCIALGEGLGVDRVIAHSIGVDHGVQLDAQWHRSNLTPLRELSLLPEAGGLAEELWLSAGFRARDDLLEEAAQPSELDRTFRRETGARAVIVAPIGLHDRVIGMIYVFMVDDARAWTTAETNVVQAVAGFVARAIVEAEHQANQREYVERIEKLDRQKSDFLATVSHELRTPLTSISGYLELLQEDGAGELSAQQHRMLEVISRNTVRLSALIEDVTVLSRIEGAVSKATFAGVSVQALITRVGEELSPLARGRDIDLELEPGPPEAVVLGDRVSLDRAVVNVLSNAIKFSHPGGAVTMSSTVDGEGHTVTITCQDHGVGIPARDQADLFTRFFRASNATEQAIPGTGLGLSITKQIIEDHHEGQVRVVSVEDEGTTVVLNLPLYEPSHAEPGPASETLRRVGNVGVGNVGVGNVGDGNVGDGNDSESEDVFGIRA